MKKILLIILFIFTLLLYLNNGAMAYTIDPKGKMYIKYAGEGFINVPNNFTVYSEPDLDSSIIAQYDLASLAKSNVVDAFENLNDMLMVYNPEKKLAYIPVTSQCNGGWFEIILSQETGETGWINLAPENYMTHKKFYDYYGIKNGVYMLREIHDIQKGLYCAPYETSKILFGFTVAKHIRLVLVKGNWMMVIVTEYDGKIKLGWIRWKTNEGKVLIFPTVE